VSFLSAIESPRVELARLETPVHAVDWSWGERRLYVKRDDLTGAALSGNKVRKLEYLLADARSQQADIVLTCGGIQSNHARATAVAARRMGLDCCLVLGGDAAALPDGNNLLARMTGAQIRFVDAPTMERREVAMAAIAAEFKQVGRRPYVICTGGSDALGVLGYLRCAAEIDRDVRALPTKPAHVLVAVGSGGTFGGLHLGLRALGSNIDVIGATVDADLTYWRDRLAGYLAECDRAWKLNAYDPAQPLNLIHATGIGYAKSTDDEIDFLLDFAARTGIILDPVYTGKAMFAFDRAVRSRALELRGDVLFVHTGGVFGLMPAREMIATRMANCAALDSPHTI